MLLLGRRISDMPPVLICYDLVEYATWKTRELDTAPRAAHNSSGIGLIFYLLSTPFFGFSGQARSGSLFPFRRRC